MSCLDRKEMYKHRAMNNVILCYLFITEPKTNPNTVQSASSHLVSSMNDNLKRESKSPANSIDNLESSSKSSPQPAAKYVTR